LSLGSAQQAHHAIFKDGLQFACESGSNVLALGVDLKHALSLKQGNQIYLSKLLGDLNNPEVYAHTKTCLDTMKSLDAVACDLHPDLHSTILAIQLSERLNIPLIQVQHHHAHLAAVMVEYGLNQPVIGLAMDGFGYGTDGTAWGGECLYVNSDVSGTTCERVGYLKSVPMPGGDAASREPWRMAVAWLEDEQLSAQLFPTLAVATVSNLCKSELTPLTSSMGRLFDAASAILLGNTYAAFEGEAAIKLEQAAHGKLDASALPFKSKGGVIDMSEALHELAVRRLAGDEKPELAASFHATVANAFATLAKEKTTEKGGDDVILAGGCFLNQILETRIITSLESSGLKVWKSEQVARGDGGISLGQLWVACYELERRILCV